MPQAIRIRTEADWKAAMHRHLKDENISRYAFVRRISDEGICTTHTAECLLAESGTVTGKRMPKFSTAIQIARLAGYDLVLVPRSRT